MVDIDDIPDFPGQPGQRPTPGVPPTVVPIAVVIVTAPLDSTGTATPLNAAAVDTFIAAEIAADRAYVTTVERWAPWSDLDLPLGFNPASQYNYGRFIIDGQNFYAYLNVIYQNLTTSTFRPIPDDWTTYAPTLGYSTVVRGHVAVAASQSDTYGDLYLTAPEPIDAPPARAAVEGSILGDSPTDWKVLVVCVNDLRGSGDTPFFARHTLSDQIAQAAQFASDATANSAGDNQIDVQPANYPWVGGGGSLTTLFYWPFDPSTWNMNNGHPEDNFRTSARPSHNGMDMGYGIANITGTPIRAAGDGVVTFAAFDGSYGNRVIIEHANGYRTTYNHMDAASPLSVGDHVTAGTVVGGIGTTGSGSTGNHLHFETYKISISDYVDPLIFMAEFNPDNLVVSGILPPATDTYVPKVTPSPASTVDGVSAGGGVYLFTLDGYAEYLTLMQGAPWVLDGLVSTSIVPSWSVGSAGDASFTPVVPPTSPTAAAWASAAAIPVFVGDLNTGSTGASVLDGWRSTVGGDLGIGYYRKLLTSQFTRIVVSDGETENEFLPEVWKTSAVGFDVVTETTHGTPTIRAIPTGYTSLGQQRGIPFAFGGSEGIAQSGKALASNNTAQQDMGPWLAAYSAFTARLTLISQQALAISLARTQVQMSLGVQGVQTVLGAAMGATGGPAGVALAGAQGLGSLATSAITANNSLDILDIAQDGSFDIATYQLGLSGIASYYSFNAWAQSLDAVSGRGARHTLAGAWRAIIERGLDILIVVPTADAVSRALSTWKRFGYMIERAFVPPRLDAMDHFTYWQLEAPTILGAMPADARARIVERFTRGTTIWTNVAEIGTQPANAPRSGISY